MIYNLSPVDSELIQHAREATQRLISLAEQQLSMHLPAVEINFDLRGQSAGMVRFPAHATPQIRYNRILLMENPQHFIRQTVAHEVAHLVARHHYGSGIRPHGAEWQSVMALFGVEPRRCHDYDTSRSTTRRLTRHPYQCGCQTHQLSSIRHNRIAAGQRYHCRRCGNHLRPVTQGSINSQ